MAVQVNIRACMSDEVKVLLEMTSKDEWNFSEIDCMSSLTVDPEGLLVAEDETGTPVGFIGLFNMSTDMHYVGAFIVRKDLRGKGIGKKLWEAMLKATQNKILALDGVSELREWYKEHGFPYEAYCSKFCQGNISSHEFVRLPNSYNVVPLTDDLWPAFLAYDKLLYPYCRERALRAWFHGVDRYSVVALSDKSVVGYANYHWKSKKECNIRAVYADNNVIAETLLLNLLQNIPVGSVVSFDLLGDKTLPRCLSEFKCLKTVYRLFSKDMSDIQSDKIFIPTSHMI